MAVEPICLLQSLFSLASFSVDSFFSFLYYAFYKLINKSCFLKKKKNCVKFCCHFILQINLNYACDPGLEKVVCHFLLKMMKMWRRSQMRWFLMVLKR